MTAPDLVAEYRRLASAATTPLPWYLQKIGGDRWNLGMLARWGKGGHEFLQADSDADVELLVWLRNNADAMADEIERLQALVATFSPWREDDPALADGEA